MIDICTVVFRQELPVLQLQAQSIELYCKDLGIRNIYVVVNDEETLANEIDPAWWGELAPLVLVVPRTAFSAPWGKNGWVTQQLWKLLVPSMSYNRCTMVLDAKTIFVQPVALSQLFDLAGKIATGTLDLYPVFDSARQIVNATYNIDLQRQIGPGGVPFVFDNNTVRMMIADTAALTQQNFPEWFQSQGTLTEFVLYSGYVQHRHGSLTSLYSEGQSEIQPVNMCHSEVASADRILSQMQQATTVSIHRNAWSQLTADRQQQYRNLLIDRGITQAWTLK
jgi:hypothetical protein